MRTRQITSLVLLALYLPACMGYNGTTASLGEVLAAPEPPSALLVTTAKGSIVELRNPHLSADTLSGVGISRKTNLPMDRIPVREVSSFKVRGVSAGNTIALVGGVTLLGVLLGVAMSSAMDDVPVPSFE